MKRFTHIAFLFAYFLFSYPVFASQRDTFPKGIHSDGQQSDAFGTFHISVPYTSVIDSLCAVLKTQNNDTNKVNTLNRLSGNYKIHGSYDSALLYAESARTLAEKIRFKKGMANAFRNIGIIYFHQSDYQKALEYAFKSFTIYQGIGDKQGIADAQGSVGAIYYMLGNYSKALECYFKVLTLTQEIEAKNTIATALCNIGIIYGEQGNYSKGLEYLFRSLKIRTEEGDKDGAVIDLSNIGYSYLVQGDYTKALEYDFKTVILAKEVGDKNAVANGFDNIGNTYYEEGDYKPALEYYFKASTIAREIGDKNEVANLYSNIGEVYTKLKNYKQAKTFLDSALIISKKTGDKKYIKKTYGNLTILDSALGNYKTAYNDYKKYIAYRDSIINQESVKQITQIEISYEFEKREDSIRAEYKQENIIKTSEIKRKKSLNDATIIILVLIILLALLLINRQQIKRKKDKLFFEKETHFLLLEKHRMENELANAKITLDDYVKNMMEKNKLLEQSKIDLKKMEELKAREIDENRIERLEHLNKTTIITEEDWNKFKELFEQVYKGFFIRLKEKLPDLTQAEIRLICLIKLKLSTKQIGAILGISLDTIRTSRYRLRKKLNLSGKDSLNRIADSI